MGIKHVHGRLQVPRLEHVHTEHVWLFFSCGYTKILTYLLICNYVVGGAWTCRAVATGSSCTSLLLHLTLPWQHCQVDWPVFLGRPLPGPVSTPTLHMCDVASLQPLCNLMRNATIWNDARLNRHRPKSCAGRHRHA